ncbi:ABC transporter permease [Glycocaulis albus]|nr:ABC transporter permease [Glycocaulis albus]
MSELASFERRQPDPSGPLRPNRLARSMRDIATAFSRPRLWVFLGWRDFTVSFDRSHAGLVWSLVQPAVWISAVYIFLGPALADEGRNYLLYLSLGVALFFYLSTVIAGGSSVFLKNKGIIQNVPMPLFVLPLRHAASAASQLALHLLIPACVFLATSATFSWTMLLALPALALIVFSAAFVSAGMGLIGARFGDFQFVVTALMRVMMFVTPIFWYPQDREGAVRAIAATYNPLAHLIDIVRTPLMGELPSLQNIVGAGLTIGLSILVGGAIFVFGRRNIIRWI